MWPSIFAALFVTEVATKTQADALCFHCGNNCGVSHFTAAEHRFCCQGCLTVFELLTANGLDNYYELDAKAGLRAPAEIPGDRFAFLDQPAVRQRIVHFSNAATTRIVLRIPAIHCIACVWLLENLFRLNPAIGRSEVNFPRKEITLNFTTSAVKLSEVAGLLASLGYEPDLKFSDLESAPKTGAPRRLWMQTGVAGFAFGNNMLFAIALYLGVDAVNGPEFQRLVGYISLALAIPVLLYSAQDYFRLAWQGLKHRLLTIETPIAAGILVIFGQSFFEVISGRGVGYFDSFAGLLFFLLCGRLFQQKTYARLAFDRDFKSFFPLSITRRRDGVEEHVALSEIKSGDCLVIRNGELVPADGKLARGRAVIDYSFVTGEAEAVELSEGDYLYAGGRQMGAAIEIETTKAVSQSYLTSLWNQEIFTKPNAESLDTLINCYSQRFTKVVLAIALGTALFWAFVAPAKALPAFASVLIVACPCALALAAPFALGTAVRVLGRQNVFVKSPQVLERLAKIDTVVFDKTGTLTAGGASTVEFQGAPLGADEQRWIASVTRHSVHPHSVRIGETLRAGAAEARCFRETPGCGLGALVEGREILVGSAAWFAGQGIPVPQLQCGNCAHVAIDKKWRGVFILPNSIRHGAAEMISALGADYRLALLSGDNERERPAFEKLFGPTAILKFNQGPIDKLAYVRELQKSGCRVAMIGDGLNDAGALKQSDVGVAVVETVGAFSPASDIIMRADMAPKFSAILRFSKATTRVVLLSFAISSFYNVIGIAIAASGRLAPIVCAVLMPLSSITVVAFACAAIVWRARRAGLKANS